MGPVLRRLSWLVFGWLVVASIALMYALPWHPHSALGWVAVLLGGPPVLIAAEFLSDRLIYRSPVGVRLDAMGKGASRSALRVLYLLVCFLVVGGLCWLAVAVLNRSGWLGAL
jgi:hypothetical protein